MSASAGRVLAINRGDYNSATAYTPMDKVYYLGSTYICIADSTGNLPTNTTYWQIEAKGVSDASDLDYDNTVSGLTADDVQKAIDELASEKQDNLTFDASPTENSANPVTSGGVYTALSGKQNTLTFDNVPTENSTNPVKSGGVYSAIEDVQDYAEDINAVISANGAKNLNSYPYTDTTKTENGITFTDNGDGTVTVNGTATARAEFDCHLHTDNVLYLEKRKYKASGCPTGGSINNTYYVNFYYVDALGNGVNFNDEGNGVSFDLTNVTDYYHGDKIRVGVVIYVVNGATVNNLTFKPMITLAEQPNSDYAHYVEYAKTNRELTEQVSKLDLSSDNLKGVTILVNSTKTNAYIDFYTGETATSKVRLAIDTNYSSVTCQKIN